MGRREKKKSGACAREDGWWVVAWTALHYCVFAWREVEGARFSADLRHGVFRRHQRARILPGRASYRGLSELSPFVPVNAYLKEDVCD